MGYPLVNITNSTNYSATGTVSYLSIFCSNDDYSVAANGSWEASSRGVCLVTQISASVNVFGTTYDATPYESSGTSYSQFAIIQVGQNQFEVTRRVSMAENDVAPADYVEPTEKQK